MSILIGLGSGLVSALLFYSSAQGGSFLRPMLLFLVPLPTMVAGLGWGWMAAAAATLAGAAVVGGIVSSSIVIGYALAVGVPATLAAYLIYLSREDPSDPSVQEWYPPGRLLAAMALYAGSLPVLLLPAIGGSYESLRPLLQEVLRQFAKRWAPPDTAIPDEVLAQQTDWTLFLLPAGLAAQWLMLCAFNLYLAGRIVLASGRLGRDWPDVAALTYPPMLALVFAAALLGTSAEGALGTAAVSFTGALLAAYLIGGLALVHYISRRRAPWLVWVVYLGLFFLWPFFMPLVVAAGLLDSAFQIKRRLNLAAPPT